jgi:hypothetical protein
MQIITPLCENNNTTNTKKIITPRKNDNNNNTCNKNINAKKITTQINKNKIMRVQKKT